MFVGVNVLCLFINKYLDLDLDLDLETFFLPFFLGFFSTFASIFEFNMVGAAEVRVGQVGRGVANSRLRRFDRGQASSR